MSKTTFRTLVKECVPPVVVKLIRRYRGGRYVALDHLDKNLEGYLSHRDGFYVELGANDGRAYSNTYYFEKYKGWSGVLVEPSPHKFLQCRENRSGRNHIYCAACVSFEYAQDFVKMAYSNLMSTPMGVETDLADPIAHARAGLQFLEPAEDVFVFGAEARTLNELLLASSAPRIIDLLSLDVEGAEIEVLKGIDHEQFRFKFMLVECRDFDKLQDFLIDHGYKFVRKMSYHDYLFSNAR